MRILITGSSSGIGQFLAGALEQKGHSICRLARSVQPGLAFRCDVSNWTEVQRCATELELKWKGLDALICCAAIQGPIGPAMEADPVEWQRAVAINLEGTFFAVRAFHPLLRRAERRGKVIAFSGGGSTSPRANFTAYGASKTAVVRLVETLAEEWRGAAVDINAVAPGAIFTRMTQEVLARGPAGAGKAEYERASKQPQDSAAMLKSVLGLIEFLLSERSDGISGKLISAQWDPWSNLDRRRAELEASDIYTLRRIVPKDRGKEWD
jgi:3-oxoacyl-[acyl-carrier protein] reductase